MTYSEMGKKSWEQRKANGGSVQMKKLSKLGAASRWKLSTKRSKANSARLLQLRSA